MTTSRFATFDIESETGLTPGAYPAPLPTLEQQLHDRNAILAAIPNLARTKLDAPTLKRAFANFLLTLGMVGTTSKGSYEELIIPPVKGMGSSTGFRARELVQIITSSPAPPGFDGNQTLRQFARPYAPQVQNMIAQGKFKTNLYDKYGKSVGAPPHVCIDFNDAMDLQMFHSTAEFESAHKVRELAIAEASARENAPRPAANPRAAKPVIGQTAPAFHSGDAAKQSGGQPVNIKPSLAQSAGFDSHRPPPETPPRASTPSSQKSGQSGHTITQPPASHGILSGMLGSHKSTPHSSPQQTPKK
uniref:Coat Protein n=1 Tax=Botrytis virus F TaxID=129395 RepID=A0A0S4GAE2_9VIRU|nr:Coat Protein [Botrytis virus F]